MTEEEKRIQFQQRIDAGEKIEPPDICWERPVPQRS